MNLRKLYNVLTNIIWYPFLNWKNNAYSVLTCSLNGKGHYRGCNIGDYVYIGHNSIVNYTDIGPYTCIANNVVIGGMEHSYKYFSISPKLNPYVKFGEHTRIGWDVWIGANVVIRQGVSIGNGTIIGAGSVVTHDLPENSVAYGSPARVIKNRFPDEHWKSIKQSCYYTCNINEAKMIIKNLEKTE